MATIRAFLSELNHGAGAAAPLFIQIERYEGPLDLPL